MRTGLYQCKRCLDVFGFDNRIAADRIRPAIICDPRRAKRLRFADRRARLDRLSPKLFIQSPQRVISFAISSSVSGIYQP
jgi:hypothetical protein